MISETIISETIISETILISLYKFFIIYKPIYNEKYSISC
jgi:hypothetical protein